MGVLERVKLRLKAEENIDEEVLKEYILSITDRLNLRLDVATLPTTFNSIVVDAVVKMHRRKYYEGIKSENVDTVSTSFVDSILDEYEKEIQDFKKSSKKAKVKFL